MHTVHPYRAEIDRLHRLGAAFADQLEHVRDDQWDRATPCPEWAVRDLVAHVSSIVRDLESRAFGAPPPPAVPATSLRSGPHAARDLRRSLASGIRAWRSVHLASQRDFPWGRTPAVRMPQFSAVEVATHGWDLMTATGVTPSFRADDLEAVIDIFVRHVTDAARPGLFAAPVPIPETATVFDRLAAATGRPVTISAEAPA